MAKKQSTPEYRLYLVGGQRVIADSKTGQIKGKPTKIDLKKAKLVSNIDKATEDNLKAKAKEASKK